ncbi:MULTISPECIES: flagellin [unclassified Brevundimonas]|uniref:flagellin n=1 Tax=unclassified Brevundimonas TaxID=2622653 RepID=UPI0025BAC3F3|nr:MULTISPECIES: flagellin [unclassified Brevundimonas]
MSRVTTYGNNQSALLNLMTAQKRTNEAQNRFSTGKNATDLVGFGREAATVNALRSTQARVQTHIDTNKAVRDRLSAQDLAMDKISEAATATRLAIANAIAAGRMDGLMEELKIQFQTISDALNTQHQGQYLFSGGVSDTKPSPVANLDQLALTATVDDAFANGYLRQASRLDDNIVMDTGFLANELGSELFQIFKDIKTLDATTPLSGTIDATMNTALTGLMQRFEAAAKNIVNEQGRNGIYQKRVEDIIKTNSVKADALEIMVSDKTDADMAKAVTDLELAQVALQASAQVVSQLRRVSLLDYI